MTEYLSRPTTLTTQKLLIESVVAQSQYFNMDLRNTALRQKIKNTPHKQEKSKQTELSKYNGKKTNKKRLKL